MPTTTLKQTEQGTAVNLLTTELNSLANNSNTAPGSEINNAVGQTNLDGYVRAKAELYLAAYSGTPTSGTGVSVWFLKSIDGGTNYEDGGSSVTPARQPDLVFQVRNLASGPQRIVKECLVPVGKFKGMARNDGMGITFASSNNTIKIVLATDSGVS